MIRLALVLLALLTLPLGAGQAHELRPGYLEIQEEAAGDYVVRFKVPARGDQRLGLFVRLPDACGERAPPRRETGGDGYIDVLAVSCPGGLGGQIVAVHGLVATYTDVVARFQWASGAVQAARLTPDQPFFTVAAEPTWYDTAETCCLLGVEHILLGFDHLLFVLALLLLVRGRWMLVKTVTAFTLAHSVTLTLAVVGWAAPQAPVEAVIALSIAFAAAEALRQDRGQAGLAGRLPWIMAFAFGLLHGFGFAGALQEIGLPQTDLPLALLTFNLGIEAGQLLFVAAVLSLAAACRHLTVVPVLRLRQSVAYGIGGLAGFWFIERLVAMA